MTEDGTVYHEPVPQRMDHFPLDIWVHLVHVPLRPQTDAFDIPSFLRRQCHITEITYIHYQTLMQPEIHWHLDWGWR